jgi:outer membrane protein assembly factor BamB
MRAALLLAFLSLAGPLAAKPHRHPTLSPTPSPTPTPPAWTAFKGGPERRGLGPSLGLPVRQVWREELDGQLYSSPLIYQGLIILGSSNKVLRAVDLATGTERWRTHLPDRVWGSGPMLDPATHRVYVGCVDGCVHVVDALSGDKLEPFCADRRFALKLKLKLPRRSDVLSPPLLAEGRLVFGSDDYAIYSYPLSGAEPWRVATGDIVHDNGAAQAQGRVFMPSRDGVLYALSATTGTELWRFNRDKAFNTVPALDAQALYLGNGDGSLYCLDQASGAQRWAFNTSKGIMSSPALAPDGAVVFGSADKSIYCLEAATGKQRWSFKTGDVVLASPVITGSLVWIGSYDDELYALDLKTGAEAWRTPMKGGVFTSVAVAGDKIVAASRDGELVCLQATPAP